jgi:hypothetical protein
MATDEQREEILALKSIFDDDFSLLNETDVSVTFELRLRLDDLSTKVRLVHDESNRSSELEHLPSILLRLTLPLTYPDEQPPDYAIVCDYLSIDYLRVLADRIDQLWQPKQAIVFIWMESLRDSFHNIQDVLHLSSTYTESCDRRVITNYSQIGSKVVYEQLLDYNRMENLRQFQLTYHTCPVW